MTSRRLCQVLLLALTLLALASGCTTYREVPARQWGEVGKAEEPSRAADGALAPGDRVLIRLRNGCEFEGRLAQVGQDSLVVNAARELPRRDTEFVSPTDRAPCLSSADGRSVAVAVADIVAVQRPYSNMDRTILMGLGLTTIAVFIAFVSALNHIGGLD